MKSCHTNMPKEKQSALDSWFLSKGAPDDASRAANGHIPGADARISLLLTKIEAPKL